MKHQVDAPANKRESRVVYLTDSISGKVATTFIKELDKINEYDKVMGNTFANYIIEPIIVKLSTYGGSVYDGLGIIDAIRGSNAPVHIVVVGKAMSMGLPILLAGDKRSMTMNSTIMYHEISTYEGGKLEEFKDTVTEMSRLQELVDKMVLNRTKLLKKDLADVIKRKAEWYIPADEAKKLGIVDEVI